MFHLQIIYSTNVSVLTKMNNRKNKIYLATAVHKKHISNIMQPHYKLMSQLMCFHLSLLSKMSDKEKEREEEKEEEVFCCHSSDLSRSSSSELSGSSAGARLAYPGSFWCVHIICIHLSPADEASLSLKPRLTNSLPESCWSSLP